jgi:hypothetical protein
MAFYCRGLFWNRVGFGFWQVSEGMRRNGETNERAGARATLGRKPEGKSRKIKKQQKNNDSGERGKIEGWEKKRRKRSMADMHLVVNGCSN